MAARGSCESEVNREQSCSYAMRRFPWGDTVPTCDHAVAELSGCGCGDEGCLIQSVASKPLGVSPYGVYDLSGNAGEWMGNAWHDSYADDPAGGTSPEAAEINTVRGGSYASSPAELRASHRSHAHSSVMSPEIGFRCCSAPDSAGN